MTGAIATLNRYRNVLLIDALLLAALYLLPAVSHAIALPLYKFEPMRVALIVALLFTNRANTYLIALTIPLTSCLVTGHPEPVKAVLMGIEYSILVAVFSHLARIRVAPVFVALTAAILSGKAVYYTMKLVALNTGLLAGDLVSTPLQTQLLLAVVTAAVFTFIERMRSSGRRDGAPPSART